LIFTISIAREIKREHTGALSRSGGAELNHAAGQTCAFNILSERRERKKRRKKRIPGERVTSGHPELGPHPAMTPCAPVRHMLLYVCVWRPRRTAVCLGAERRSDKP